MDSYLQKILQIKENIEKVLVSKSHVIDMILTAFFSGGHILLEDMPGTGKTIMAKALAASVQAEFSRIQFTPDLLPSDVTGLHYYNQKEGEFVFQKGPVFCNILLADEINRATPRTQSSLLECMEEKQVTTDGETRVLDAPFFVIATQNPIETAGTFPLPEAQLDRFLMKLSMSLPSKEEEIAIMNRFMKVNPLSELSSVVNKEDIISIQRAYLEVYVHDKLKEYMVDLVDKTRTYQGVVVGVSPRGTLAFLKAVKAYAFIHGRSYVVPEDIKHLVIPVFSHRIVLSGGMMGSKKNSAVVEKILSETTVPTEDWTS